MPFLKLLETDAARQFPRVALRTSFIVGFPRRKPKLDFQELYDFGRLPPKLDWMGRVSNIRTWDKRRKLPLDGKVGPPKTINDRRNRP